MAERKSFIERLGEVLRGAPKKEEVLTKAQEEALRQAERAEEGALRMADRAKEEAVRQAERAKAEAEAKAAELQRQLEAKERELAAKEEAARVEAERRELEELKAEARRQAEEAKKAAEPQPHIYVVQPGDSLSKIAKAIYGDAQRWPAIFEANKDKIKDPNLIYPGQELRIP